MPPAFAEAIDKMVRLMERLKGSEERPWDQYGQAPKKGVYVLYESGKPIYVGRSNRMPARIRQHGAESSDRYSATFAFKLLRQSLDEPEGTAGEIELTYPDEYGEQRERVRGMTFRAVPVTDQLEQTLFEIYAILEMRTYPKYNDFNTH